jgi:hypothetical protein
VTYTVHYCEPMLEGLPERWSVVGMGPVAYCDSPRIARNIAHKLNNGLGTVCPDCDCAVTVPDVPVRNTGLVRCWHCSKLLRYR